MEGFQFDLSPVGKDLNLDHFSNTLGEDSSEQTDNTTDPKRKIQFGVEVDYLDQYFTRLSKLDFSTCNKIVRMQEFQK